MLRMLLVYAVKISSEEFYCYICLHRIEIEFLHFELEADSSCQYDVLEVREGGEPLGPLVGRFCGHQRPASYVSSGNKLYFNFRSDYSVSHAGFRIRYKTGEREAERQEERFIIHFYGQPAVESSLHRAVSFGLRTTRPTIPTTVSVSTPSRPPRAM